MMSGEKMLDPVAPVIHNARGSLEVLHFQSQTARHNEGWPKLRSTTVELTLKTCWAPRDTTFGQEQGMLTI
jgi:hypothetical protein